MSLLLFSVQYLSYIYHYIKQWRENPEWSLSCCLALLLPLRNLQGEIGGLAGRDIPLQQLKTDRIDTTSTANMERDSGAVVIMLEDYDAEREEEEEEKEEEEEREEEEKEEEEREEKEKEEEEKEEEEDEEDEEKEDEDDDTANQITVEQGVVTVVEVIIHPPPSGIQDTKL